MDEKRKPGPGWVLGVLSRQELRQKAVIFLGLMGMALILLSILFPGGGAPKGETELSAGQYEQALEKRLHEIIGSIEGVGAAKVMVTLEGSGQVVYARQEKTAADSTEEFEGELPRRVQQRNTSEDEYILVEGEGGRRQALVLSRQEPRVRGVVVLCQGAGNPVVEQRVIRAVTTALDLSSARVCVTKIHE